MSKRSTCFYLISLHGLLCRARKGTQLGRNYKILTGKKVFPVVTYYILDKCEV